MSSRRAAGHTSAHEIYAAIVGRVSRWELPAGERLTEERLSRDFGVSRTPVREALRLLEQAGFIERTGGRGYSVRAFDLRRVDQIYTIRVVLEELAVELAAGAVGTPAFAELREAARVAARSAHEGGGQDDLLREQFHEQLARLSGNEELLRLLQDMDSRLYAMRRFDAALPARASEAQSEHMRVLELLESGDVTAARIEMRQHIERSQTTLRVLMDAGITTLSFGALPTSPDGAAA